MVIDTIPTMAWSALPDGCVDFLSQRWLDYTGLSTEQALNWGWKTAIHPDDLPGMLEIFERAVKSGQPFEADGRFRRSDGEFRWFLFRASPLRAGSGEVLKWYGTNTDLEERKRAELALLKAFEQIKSLKDQLYRENLALKEEIDRSLMFEEIVGSSPALQAVLSSVLKVAPTDSTVLITGETGTGKELIARAIHKHSQRSGQAFISVNCASIPSTLIASELFGHEKGAFSGALRQRQGRFELAHSGTLFLDEIGELPAETQIALLRVLQERATSRKMGRFELANRGTLFLDEIGDIPLELQAKLLRVLQEQEFERLGSNETQQVNVRIVVATHRDLKRMVAEKLFRSDLYFRLNIFPILVPPLRDRPEDIPLLANAFVNDCVARMNRRVETVPEKTMQALTKYHWPGNVRELQNFIERAVIMSPDKVLRAPLESLNWPEQKIPVKPQTLAQAQSEYILNSLREANWVVGGPNGAAKKLGIKRTTLIGKMRRLGLARSMEAASCR